MLGAAPVSYTHLGAGFVGTDDRDAAKALDRFQVFHDGVLTGHFLGAQGQHDGHDAAQRLGDGRHGKGHGEHERIHQTQLAAKEGQGEHQRADGEDHGRQLAGKIVEAFLQGGVLSEHSNNISLNEKLFARIKAVYEQKDQLQLKGEPGAYPM